MAKDEHGRIPMGQPNEDKLNNLIGKMLGDLGGAFGVPTVRIGLRLGLFDAMHNAGRQRLMRSPKRPATSRRVTCASGR
jgi:hypothetical protein